MTISERSPFGWMFCFAGFESLTIDQIIKIYKIKTKINSLIQFLMDEIPKVQNYGWRLEKPQNYKRC